MSVFNRKDDSVDPIPEDLKPYYQGKNTAWQRWLGPVLRGLVLLAVLALLVWGGIWSVNKIVHRNDDSGKSTTSTSDTQKKPTPSPTASTPGSATSPTPTPTPTTPSTPTTPATAPTPTPATTPASDGTLANTGPGEVIAAFVGTVVVATIGFYFVRAYQLTASQK